jgi:hypothetical protein
MPSWLAHSALLSAPAQVLSDSPYSPVFITSHWVAPWLGSG